MRLLRVALSSVLLLSPMVARAQDQSVPRLINITGVFRPADGQPPAATETITVSIYADQNGGTPLWQETQPVALDDRGRYTVVLGAAHADGIPPSVFAAGAQWLGTVFTRSGEVEGPRVRLTSVPYAMRAVEADTLGGRPASDYLLATDDTRKATVASRADVANPTGTVNFVPKYVDAVNLIDSAIYENGGAVGLGTTTPSDMFHVRFTNTGGNLTGFAVQNLGNTATSYSGMLFYDQNNQLGQFQGFNNGTHEYRINNIARTGGQFDGSINFMIGSSSKFFVGGNGNIGIGTTAPSADFALDIVRSTDALISTTTFSPFISASGLFARAARGTPSSPAALQRGDWLGVFAGVGADGASFGFNPNANIHMIAAENWAPGAHGTAIVFQTTEIGEVNETLFTMSILSNGNVGIGTPSDLVTGLPTATDRLQVFGDVRVGTTGTNGCVKDFSGAGLVGTCSSDRRFKKNISPFGSVLNQLSALQPVHYYWRASEFPDRHFGDSQAAGLIAQDVEQVLPELVETDTDGYKAVNYSKLPLFTIQALKELKADNDALTQRVAELERLVEELLAKR
jgi:endosialidase-like protein